MTAWHVEPPPSSVSLVSGAARPPQPRGQIWCGSAGGSAAIHQMLLSASTAWPCTTDSVNAAHPCPLRTTESPSPLLDSKRFTGCSRLCHLREQCWFCARPSNRRRHRVQSRSGQLRLRQPCGSIGGWRAGSRPSPRRSGGRQSPHSAPEVRDAAQDVQTPAAVNRGTRGMGKRMLGLAVTKARLRRATELKSAVARTATNVFVER
jgi:hypothetical protein